MTSISEMRAEIASANDRILGYEAVKREFPAKALFVDASIHSLRTKIEKLCRQVEEKRATRKPKGESNEAKQ